DTVAAHMSLKLPEKQKVLEILDIRKRLEHILVAIEGEMDVLQIEKRIRGRVKAQMEKSQREYYLNEQMKAPMSAEATVVRNYIDWLVKVPWKKRTKIIKDIGRAEKVLDEDHYGL